MGLFQQPALLFLFLNSTHIVAIMDYYARRDGSARNERDPVNYLKT